MPARLLPDRPNLSQYKKQAKELVKALRSADADALARVKAQHPRLGTVTESDDRLAAFVLADAQLVIAREHGIESWPKFVQEIETRSGADSPLRVWKLAERAVIVGDVPALERLIRDHEQLLKEGPPQASWFDGLPPRFSGADVRPRDHVRSRPPQECERIAGLRF